MKRSPLYLMCAFLSLGLGACASTPSAIPEIRSTHLPKPVWPGVTPRSVVFSVSDERNPLPPESPESVRRVREAVTGALQKGGVSPAADSPNHLTLTLEDPERVPDGFGVAAECVLARMRLEFSKGRAEAWSVGCYEQQEIAFASGADATDSFRNALRGAMQGLERQLQQFEKQRPQ